MAKDYERVRVEILCDWDLVERQRLITHSTCTTRNFLIRKAIRLYLDHRERMVAAKLTPGNSRTDDQAIACTAQEANRLANLKAFATRQISESSIKLFAFIG